MEGWLSPGCWIVFPSTPCVSKDAHFIDEVLFYVFLYKEQEPPPQHPQELEG